MKCVIITWVECRESHRQGSTTHYCLHCGRFVPAVTSLWRPKSPLRIYLTVTTLLEPTRGAERCHKYKSSFSCVMMAYSWERGAMIAGNHPRSWRYKSVLSRTGDPYFVWGWIHISFLKTVKLFFCFVPLSKQRQWRQIWCDPSEREASL